MMGDFELFRGIAGGGGEEIGDESDEVGGGEEFEEEGAKGGDGAGGGDGHARFDAGIGGKIRDGVWGKGKRGDGGREGGEKSFLCFVGVFRQDDDGDDELVALDEEFGELGDGDEVAHAWSGKKNYMRPP